MALTAENGGLQTLLDPFYSSFNDMPFGDELFANFSDHTDASETTLCGETSSNGNDLSSSSLPLSNSAEHFDLQKAMDINRHHSSPQDFSIPADGCVSTNDPSADANIQQTFALPPLRPKTPSSSFQPKHSRGPSSLRHEFCPIEPSTQLLVGTVEDITPSGTWTSSPSHYRQGRFTQSTNIPSNPITNEKQQAETSILNSQHQSVNMLLPSPDFTHNNGTMHSPQSEQYTRPSNSQGTTGYIHTTQYPYTESLRHEQLSSIPQSPFLPPQPRDRSYSAPGAHQHRQQLPVIAAGKSRQMAPAKTKRDLEDRQFMALPAQESNLENKYVGLLIAAMRDMTRTEDNPGMLDTWRKLMKSKHAKIGKVCRSLYVGSLHLLRFEPH